MIKVENVEVMGWMVAIRGMRNPLNSWDKSDSRWFLGEAPSEEYKFVNLGEDCALYIGPNDQALMKKLRNAGTDHRKFMRMITVYMDITAPLYWWKEFDTYKVGTVANSCSTMHKIANKEFTLEDFSHEHLLSFTSEGDERKIPFVDVSPYANGDITFSPKGVLECIIIPMLNCCQDRFLESRDKKYWWQMIQLLPSSYNQKRTVLLNYEVLANMHKSRKSHKLDEWVELCEWMKTLPYSELITGEFKEETNESQESH